MVPGLVKILDLIKANPNDQRLLSRYVALANELGDAERCDAILQVARVLLAKAPHAALDVAWGLFKSGKLEHEALLVMASALENLGKSGKAAAIRVDAIRLTSHPTGTSENDDARRRIDTAMGALQSTPPSQFSNDGGTKTNNKATPDVAVNKIGQSQTSMDEEFNLEPKVASGVVLHRDVPEAYAVVETATPQFDLAIQSVAADNLPNSTAPGIPEAIPPKEPSNHSRAFFERGIRTKASIASSGASIEEASVSSFPSPKDHENCHSYLKQQIQANRWEDILRFVTEGFQGLDDPFLLTIFETYKLTKIDLQFVGLWLDILIANRQERRVLRLCIQILTEEPHLAWAKMMQPRVIKVIDRLGLEQFDWREVEGVAALRRKIARLRPKSLVYPVFPQIGP